MLTLAEVAEATGGRLTGDATIEVSGVSTDTRALTPGCLFVALKGANYDGHAYVDQAVREGAAAVLVEEGWDGEVAAPAVRVSDTLSALGRLARYWRRKLDPVVIAITGSSGKTSTKETVAAYLGFG